MAAERRIGAIFQFGVDQASQKQAEAAITGLKNFAAKALGTIGIAFSLSGANKIIEQYSQINDRIAYAAKGIMDAAEAQNLVSQAARDSRTSYASMVDQVTKLANGNSKLFDIESATKFSKLMNQIGKSAGMDDSKVQTMNSYMGRIMSLGQTNKETFTRLQTQAPEVLKVIADGLGTNVEQLGDMAKQGTLTAEKIKNAVFLQEGAISAAYAKTSGKVSEGISAIRDAWGKALASADKQLGITAKIYDWCIKIANKIEPFFNNLIPKVQTFVNNMGGIENILKIIAAFAGASHLPKILDFVKKIGSAMGLLNIKTMAVVAAFLLIDDFISFMRNDGKVGFFSTLFGENGDEVREQIQGVLDKFDTLKEWFSENVDPEKVFIVAVFIAIAKAIGDIAAKSGALGWIKNLLGVGSAGGVAIASGEAASTVSLLPVLGQVVATLALIYGAVAIICGVYEKATGKDAKTPAKGLLVDFYGEDAVNAAWDHSVQSKNQIVDSGNAKARIATGGLSVSYDKDGGLPMFSFEQGQEEILTDMNAAFSSLDGYLSEIIPKLDRPNNHTLNFTQTNNFNGVDANTGLGVAQQAFTEIDRMNQVAANS